jgi:hypothetical protein
MNRILTLKKRYLPFFKKEEDEDMPSLQERELEHDDQYILIRSVADFRKEHR